MPEGGGRYASVLATAIGVDLIITSFTVTPLSPTAGDNVVFTVTVKNQGTVAVTAGRANGQNIGVGIYLDGASTPVTYTNYDGGLAPGASFTQDTVSGWAPGGGWFAIQGTHTAMAWVDDQNLIPEANDTNNQTSISLTVAAGTGGSGGTTKYYVASSSWNTPIPAGRTYTDNAQLKAGGWFEYQQYGIPVVTSAPTDPVVTIPAPASWGYDAQTIQLRIPTSGVGATGTDGSLCVIDGNTAWDFWQFHRSGNTATCSAWAKSNIVTETGWANNGTFPAAGIHATGSALLAGLIFGNELKNGFSHALAVDIRGDMSTGGFIYPAINSDGGGGTINEGQRLGIPPGVSMPGGMSVPAQNIWRACQTYGCFVIDTAGISQSVEFVADTITTDPHDADLLYNAPTYDAPDLATITNALRIVTPSP